MIKGREDCGLIKRDKNISVSIQSFGHLRYLIAWYERCKLWALQVIGIEAPLAPNFQNVTEAIADD